MDKNCDLSCRRNRVGGQAVIEGVMMKNGSTVALAVRKEDGTVEIDKSEFTALKTKHKWLNIPIVRGVVGFFESMVLSFKTLGKATDMLGLEEEEEREKEAKRARKEEKRKEKLAKKGIVQEDRENGEKDGEVSEKGEENPKKSGATTVFIMVISLLLGLALALFLFSVLPTYVGGLFAKLTGWDNRYAVASVEGVVKVIIFIAYLGLVSLMKDIRRTFQYHGAEHKSIACFESGMELTPENARKCTRFHPRCGTSFMFVMILIGIIAGMFIPVWENMIWLRVIIKIAILPLIMGVGYEFIMVAGKHDNKLTRALSAPGLWMQRITTKEPDDYQLAIAICAIKASMPEEFPDFDPGEYAISREENKGHICFFDDKKSKKDGEVSEN
ncbi:MAG: DUF1385 domain-containing protein [Clostridia bacterium]|nr:DUF1385 domain-containing protein [Clostridia bacterium]